MLQLNVCVCALWTLSLLSFAFECLALSFFSSFVTETYERTMRTNVSLKIYSQQTICCVQSFKRLSLSQRMLFAAAANDAAHAFIRTVQIYIISTNDFLFNYIICDCG